MKLEHDRKMYPPKVAITTRVPRSVQYVEVMVSNVEEADRGMEITLDPGTCSYNVTPHVHHAQQG